MANQWHEALAECDTLEKFNEWALPLARERRGDFARAVAAEAMRRKYTWIGDRQTGSYAEVTPEEYAAVLAELDRRERNQMKKRLYRQCRATKVKFVHAAWMQDHIEDVGVMVVLDFRKKDEKSAREFEGVPRKLFDQLFQKGADLALRNLYKMLEDVTAKVPDYREAG